MTISTASKAFRLGPNPWRYLTSINISHLPLQKIRSISPKGLRWRCPIRRIKQHHKIRLTHVSAQRPFCSAFCRCPTVTDHQQASDPVKQWRSYKCLFSQVLFAERSARRHHGGNSRLPAPAADGFQHHHLK